MAQAGPDPAPSLQPRGFPNQMGQELYLGPADVLQFAAWSGDCNPLHVDPDAAHRSSFGRPVVHGVLTTLRALDCAPSSPHEPIRSITVEFRHPVHPDQPFTIEPLAADGGFAFALRTSNETATVVRVNETPSRPILPSDWVRRAS